MTVPVLWSTNTGDIPVNDLPNSTAISFGDAPSPLGINMTDIGSAGKFLSAGANPAGVANDYIVAVFALPAGTFGQAARGLLFEAGGGFASNTNAKRTKLIWAPTATPVVGAVVSGGTVIADTGSYSITGAVGWSLAANVFKLGAAGSNTQLGIHLGAQIGATVGSLVSPVALTATESGIIYVALTANAATAATDITANFLFVNGVN